MDERPRPQALRRWPTRGVIDRFSVESIVVGEGAVIVWVQASDQPSADRFGDRMGAVNRAELRENGL